MLYRPFLWYIGSTRDICIQFNVSATGGKIHESLSKQDLHKTTKSTKQATSILTDIGTLQRAGNLYFWFISIVHNKWYELYCYSTIIVNIVCVVQWPLYRVAMYCIVPALLVASYMCNEWLTDVMSWPFAYAQDEYIPAEFLQKIAKEDFSNVIAGLTALLGSRSLHSVLLKLSESSLDNSTITPGVWTRWSLVRINY